VWVGDSGPVGDLGEQFEGSGRGWRAGDGPDGIGVVLGGRVEQCAAAEARLVVPLLEGVEHGGELVGGIIAGGRDGRRSASV